MFLPSFLLFFGDLARRRRACGGGEDVEGKERERGLIVAGSRLERDVGCSLS